MYLKKGVSFLEILFVLFLLSLFASFIIPTFIGKQKHAAKKQFIADFVTMMQESLYQAINTNKIHQIYFDLDNHEIISKAQDKSLEKESQHKQFLPATDAGISNVRIPEQLVIRNFFIQNEDEFQTGNIMNDVFFYIMPDGTSQSIIINIEEQDPDAPENSVFALTINPFYSQVQEHDTFQKP